MAEWIEFGEGYVLGALPSDVGAAYAAWLTAHPAKAGRLGEIVDQVLADFRTGLSANPNVPMDEDETKLEIRCVPHALASVVYHLMMEMGLSINMSGMAQGMTLAALPGYDALAAVEEAVAGEVPVYAALAGSAEELRVSPLLGPLDVWGEGPLGVLAREALAALDAGDVSGYLVKAADYWIGMDQALKRREAHQRGGRRSGSGAEVGP